MISDDFRQGQEFRKLFSENGAQIIDLGHGEVGFSMPLRPLFFLNTLILPRVYNAEILKTVEELPYKCRSLFTSVAPKVIINSENAEVWKKLLMKYGYKPAKFGLAPTKTLELDISLPEQSILAQMKSKTRYNIRLAQRKGVKSEIVSGDQILSNISYLDNFYKIYKDNCIRIKMKSDPKEKIKKLVQAFKKNIFIVYSYADNDEIVAVALYIVSGNTIAYQMNGSTEIGRKYFATNLVVWEGIKEGKRRGCKWFDFDGIYDERFKKAQQAWIGFSRFKKGFGGYERIFLGSYVKWFPFIKNF